MDRKRKTHSDQFKAKVALDAVRNGHTISELATRHQVHPTQITKWKKRLVQGAPELFAREKKSGVSGVGDIEKLMAPLYEEIGRLKMEVDFLQKKL